MALLILKQKEQKSLVPCLCYLLRDSWLLDSHFYPRYGPRQSKNTSYSEKGRLNVEVKFAPFSCTKRRAPIRVSTLQHILWALLNVLQDAEDRSIAVAIHNAIVASVRLELLPKSTIDIFLTIIENDGIEGCVAAGSIAASTALADAGIDLIGLVMSCSGVSAYLCL